MSLFQGPKKGRKLPFAGSKKKPIQRKKKVLKQRLKVPPPLNQFTKTLNKNLASFRYCCFAKYQIGYGKHVHRLKEKTVEAKKPIVVKYGLNHVTYLIEHNKAQLVVIAHDVNPIELLYAERWRSPFAL
ncbi:putative 50S ribosomal protein L30e [Rosa chinensis]|uniref:Putative 50S ribosomal protein L30e n=1 Tax=Rosa chinensis TaxID=74649 RepID=A0A2P6RFM0_ROSCH|nr:putative 50S ribosomal protein L30e [Rosa chinensis]